MTEQTNPVGRPSELLEVLVKANAYLMGEWEIAKDVIPSIAGLACYCGKNRDSMYQYAKESKEFSDILSNILTLQENKLLNGGLSGAMNPTITKLVLSKHNYHEKVETDLKSSDGSMTPKSIDLSNLTDEQLRVISTIKIND